MNIVIVDYGLGNPGSILNMLRYLDIEATISDNSSVISNAKKLILPGVGSFDNGIKNLKTSGLYDVLMQKVLGQKIPILGICLGMQLMTINSEEGIENGFGWIDAVTKKFDFTPERGLKVPHIGWNRVNTENPNIIMYELQDISKFYFVHSYYVSCRRPHDIVCSTTFGIDFTSVFAKDNIYGCQFHPEKSHKYGMQLLKNFNSL
jgi:glutamine amidotransferase